MTQATQLKFLQQNLTYAFKWMAKATKYSQKGDFASATHCMVYAMEYWAKCQHERDKRIDEETAEKLDWKFFTTKALAMAKKELAQDDE